MDTNDPGFVPPHCPNPDCLYHQQLTVGWRYKYSGTFPSQSGGKRIRRFQCKHCPRNFSTQTFSPTYWLKRPDILAQLPTKTTGCMANRQIARDLRCSPTTINRQLSRLGRHCLLFHQHLLHANPPADDLVIDGLETFEYSQYFPFHHNLAIDNACGTILGFTDSPLRRKGGMTPAQKRRRQELEASLGRPDPRAVETGIRELLSPLVDGLAAVTIRSDDHRAYGRALRGLRPRIRHEVTSSKERRDQHNRLWEVNLADLVLRHASKNHTRETIAWSKRRQCSSERLAVFVVWRNCVQWRREKRRRETPALGVNRRHELKRAV